MTGHTTARSASRLALYGALASLVGVIASACGSTEEKLKAAKLSEGCSLDSQCEGDLVCIFGRCHRECDEDEDCDPGQRCVKGDDDTNVCQLDSEISCERDKDCEGDQVCAVDSECHDPCTSGNQCIAEQVCVPSGACASSDPTRDELDAAGNLVTKRIDGGSPGTGGTSSAGGTGSGGEAGVPDGSAGGASSGGASGAGGEEGTGGASGSGGDGSGGDGSGGSSGITCTGAGLERFRPSNLPQGYTVTAGSPEYTHASTDCIFDTDDIPGSPPKGPHFTCTASASITSPVVVTMSDGIEAAVLPLKTLTIPVGVTLKIAGRRPVILAVSGDVVINGSLVAAAGAVSKWFAGGATWRTGPFLSGLCPIETVAGGGGASRSTDNSGGGGGAFCGKGGNSVPTTGEVVLGGVPYGTKTLVPLLGGSSGGLGDIAPSSGPHGGGAVQIISGSSIVLGETAIINMGGGASIETGAERAGGGGSGGGILLEAPIVTVRGVLAANGAAGSGGYLSHPQDGLSVDQPAICRLATCGIGSAAGEASGADAPTAKYGGAGGAGRIRINVGCGGTLTIGPTAIISPNETSGCYTRGALR